jgi:hypothetical protein
VPVTLGGGKRGDGGELGIEDSAHSWMRERAMGSLTLVSVSPPQHNPHI